jgi:pimeloyl-ACP methyl ester carboxylesterase
MRAREPDHADYITRDGVRLWYEVFGAGETTIMLMPGWGLPGRSWKAQIPYLARYFRVIAYDPRGTGSSDRPTGPSAYALAEHVADAVAILDAVGAGSAVVVGKSRGAQTALTLATEHPERVNGLIVAAPMIPMSPWPPHDLSWAAFEEPSVAKRKRAALRSSVSSAGLFTRSRELRHFVRRVDVREAAHRFSRQSMLADFDGFARWFVTRTVATDPHSTKQIDDLIGWLTASGAPAVADSFIAECIREPDIARALGERLTCPVLVIHGDRDLIIPLDWGSRFAELTGGKLLVVPGAGHLPGVRYPVIVNLAIREFVDSLVGAAR